MGNGVNWSDMWNNWGNFGFGGGGMGMPFGGGGMGCTFGDGFNYGNVGDSWGGSSSSSSSKLSYEEKKAKNLETQKQNREFNALKKLLDDLAKDETILSFAEREDLKYDVTHLQGKNKEEKFESLKALYNKYKDTIRNNLGKLGDMSKDFAGIGYKSETEIDEAISGLSSDISDNTVMELKLPEKYEVLDLLSSWNSNSSTSGKHMMNALIEAYNNTPMQDADTQPYDARKKSLETMGTTLKSQLATKAGELANNAMLKDDTLKDQLKKLKGTLEVLQFQYCAETFNELYKACRIAGAKIIENTYKEKYEFLGGDNLFGDVVANTIEDLKNEDFDETVNIDNLKDAKAAKKEALKKHADISILESCGKCQTRSCDRVAWVETKQENEVKKKITHSGVGSDKTLKELYDNDAIMDVSYSPDDDNGRWDKNGKDDVKANLGKILDGINQTLVAAGLDSAKLSKAKAKVLDAYINKGCSSLQDDKSDMKRKSDDGQEKKEYALEHIVANLDGDGSRGMKDSYKDTRHKIIDIHDDDGYNTHLFIVRIKDLVDDILEEYNKAS